MDVRVDETEVAGAHARLVDADMAYSLVVVKKALPMWLEEECEALIKECSGRRSFREWLDHYAVREFSDCKCRYTVGDRPGCPVHGTEVTA